MALPAHADEYETNWYYEVDKQSAWQGDLTARLQAIEEVFAGRLGVYVQNLASGEAYSWRADDPWYLASLIKIPVAAQVLAERQAGTLSLDERLTLARSDFVDGAGPTNWHDPGTPISIRYLMEQMLTVSDNTATDMLIDRVGLEAVNQRARTMIATSGGNPDEIGPISKLVGVRQGVYGELHPDARALGGMDFIALRQHSVSQRGQALARVLGVSTASFTQPDYDHAFDAYQATGENVGTLSAFGDLLASLHTVQQRPGMDDVNAEQRQMLLDVMRRTRSGKQRLKAGMGEGISFAHKTGTQQRRSCDAGIAERTSADTVTAGPWVIVTCTRGPVAVSAHERALTSVGEALRYSGALGKPW
ncbi:serine hydrolase [Halomonas sp. ISL-60]|uniref:serine hydrolase n=1 Tax=Halomonas sp. ISL-56 TaxID=2819149 RepID=UPI001BE789F9|nr:serine hydrolase [Halomonas sp. ISL-56]MBT2772420.1 serine hydrolase [Halomonas sp. ISL-60]MBT2803399.1 serine hydrolase [Halomonas sp. ISL-56]